MPDRAKPRKPTKPKATSKRYDVNDPAIAAMLAQVGVTLTRKRRPRR